MTASAEPLLRLGRVRGPHHAGHCSFAQGSQAQNFCPWPGNEAGKKIGFALGRPGGYCEEYWKPVDAAAEVKEEAQRGWGCPVDIVHNHKKWRVLSQTDHAPAAAMNGGG